MLKHSKYCKYSVHLGLDWRQRLQQQRTKIRSLHCKLLASSDVQQIHQAGMHFPVLWFRCNQRRFHSVSKATRCHLQSPIPDNHVHSRRPWGQTTCKKRQELKQILLAIKALYDVQCVHQVTVTFIESALDQVLCFPLFTEKMDTAITQTSS